MTNNATYNPHQVIGIINSVLGKIKTPAGAANKDLSQELLELKKTIENLHNQLMAMQPDGLSREKIPDATSELDAVVGATEKATETIMENCEKIIEATKDSAPDLFQQVETHVVKIFEACTFQDIVGQRIKKVMGCLKEIDAKTASVLKALQQEDTATPAAANTSEKVVSLLNGPALPQNAITQDDIDKLLAEFDSNNT